MKINLVFFIIVGIVLFFLTATWVGGLIYTILHNQEWIHEMRVGMGAILTISGLSLLFTWGTWFKVGFLAMGAKEKDL